MSSAPAASAAALSGAASKKARKKRNDLDISKKQEIALFLKQLDKDGVKKTFQEVADLFSAKWETDVHEAAVQRIKKSTQEILDAMPAVKKRMRLGKLTDLEKLLEVFVTQARANKLTLDYGMIADQAKQLTDPELGGDPSLAPEDFKFSQHWVRNFCRRHGIKYARLRREANSVTLDMM